MERPMQKLNDLSRCLTHFEPEETSRRPLRVERLAAISPLLVAICFARHSRHSHAFNSGLGWGLWQLWRPFK
jgi:hypothetical protein